MKKYFIILSFILGIVFTQDRTVIFNTGSPDSLTNGYEISSSQSIANRFTVSNDYVLEAMVFYMTLQSPTGIVTVSVKDDNNGVPGENINESATWDHTLTTLTQNGYNLITTTDLCIYLDAGEYYWLTIETANPTTEATWVYSNFSGYQYSQYNAENDNWTSGLGYAGAGGIWAEQIYEAPFNTGDVNFDFTTNVVDLVLIVGHILSSGTLNEQAIEYADINSDSQIDVVDIVQLVSIILTEQSPNPNFILEDINPASEFFGQDIGPSFFNGEVSAYYFGKGGWSMCRARFGILNDMNEDLIAMGIEDVNIVGVNGYQYLDDNISCMICSDECTSSTCDSGPRNLPWVQDYDDGLNCQGLNEGLCEEGDETSDVWDSWNALLRDFVILDRNGVEFARINLTYNNPDPNELGECSGNYQKIIDLILAARNR